MRQADWFPKVYCPTTGGLPHPQPCFALKTPPNNPEYPPRLSVCTPTTPDLLIVIFWVLVYDMYSSRPRYFQNLKHPTPTSPHLVIY